MLILDLKLLLQNIPLQGTRLKKKWTFTISFAKLAIICSLKEFTLSENELTCCPGQNKYSLLPT